MVSVGSVAAAAVDPIGAVAGAVAGPVTSAVTGAVNSTVGALVTPLVSGFARVGLYILFVTAGLGLVVLAISRLTKGPRQAAEQAAGNVAKVAAVAAA